MQKTMNKQYNSIASTDDIWCGIYDWSTACTIANELHGDILVSKYIDNKKANPMTIDNRPVHLYFGRDIEELKMTPETFEWLDTLSHKWVICETWDKLPELLRLNPTSICFNHSELKHSSIIDIVNMVRTLSKLVGASNDIPIAIDVAKETHIDIVKLVQKSGVFGIIPRACDFSISECEKGAVALWAKIPYWPKHIIEQLPGAKKHEPKKPGEIKLTTRQQQIVNLIKERGASNKVIAKTLNISESTVKLHVGLVLKKFGVKNRTQLALFSK